MKLMIERDAARGQALVGLFEQLMGVYSVSGSETELADAVEAFLRALGYGESANDGLTDPDAAEGNAVGSSGCGAANNGNGDVRGGCDAHDADGQHPLTLHRMDDTVVVSTNWGKAERVVLAGHLDTVPVIDNFPPVWLEASDAKIREDVADAHPGERVMWGRGATDMKASDAVFLYIAALAAGAIEDEDKDSACSPDSCESDAPAKTDSAAACEEAAASSIARPADRFRYDLTFVFYDHEEVAADLNGLKRVAEAHPDWLRADFAIIGEPTDCGIEGGCNGTMRFDVVTHGVAAHSARAWMGHNAIHDAAAVLDILAAYEPRDVKVDGLAYREGVNATMISGGTGTNIIPDECRVHVNYRFAPDKTIDQAKVLMFGGEVGCADSQPQLGGGERVAQGGMFSGFGIEMKDESPSARPGMDAPLARSLAALVRQRTGADPQAKLGWTDVARFSQIGVPAVNLGAGSPLLAHKADEQLPEGELMKLASILIDWLCR